MRSRQHRTAFARSLRTTQTDAEGLLWSLLRSKQLCGLKFRRQHPIGPFFVDFACESRDVVVELDGDYHDHIQDDDLRRQRFLENQGWKVIRFVNNDVVNDAEAVTRSIARQLDLPFSFRKRTSNRSGMMSENGPGRRPGETKLTPHPAVQTSDLPHGEVKNELVSTKVELPPFSTLPPVRATEESS